MKVCQAANESLTTTKPNALSHPAIEGEKSEHKGTPGNNKKARQKYSENKRSYVERMALRRPLLLLCVLTIVLGISYEVSRPAFPEAENTNFKTPFTPLTPVSDGSPTSTVKLKDEESRPPFSEVADADFNTPFRTIDSDTRAKLTDEKSRFPFRDVVNAVFNTPFRSRDSTDKPAFAAKLTKERSIPPYRGVADAGFETPFKQLRQVSAFTAKLTKDKARRSDTGLKTMTVGGRWALVGENDSIIIDKYPGPADATHGLILNMSMSTSTSNDDCLKADAILEQHVCLWQAHSVKGLLKHALCQLHQDPGAATESKVSDVSGGYHKFDFAIYRKEFQPNGTDFRCSLRQDDHYLDAILPNISLFSSFHEKMSRGKDITSTTKQQLKLVSLCIMLARFLLSHDDLRRRLLNLKHMAMMNGNSIQDIIKTAVRNILTREGLPSLLLNCTANDKPLEDILAKFIEDETPSLPMKDRRFGHLSSYLGMQDEQNGNKIKPRNIRGQDKSATYAGFDLEKDTHRDSKWNGLSQYLTSFIPRRPVVYTVFPASFLPNPGASVKDRMSHVLNRLASLNSLPASCDISRVRLAEAGFFYDNSKTARDASNVHEVVCYSCGLTYGQWKKGDNPTAVHINIKPDCEYIRSKNVSQSTPLASSSNASSHVPESGSSFASSGVSMSNDNASLLSTSASTLSSGHGSLTTESMQQTSMPHNSLSLADSGLGTGSFCSGASGSDSSHHQTPFENRSAATRSDGGDLATDCSAIAPQPRSSNQSTFFGLARDSAVSSQLSYQSSYSTSRDTSRARALDLDDRPPLDMNSAVYPQFCRHQERRATFSTWPLSDLFRPDDLVMQGFYYAGYADCLRCFYCGVGLKSWAEDDDVMVEHIRWRPSCGYVLNTKGRQYVDRILNSLGQANSNGEQSNRDSTSRASQPNSEQSTTPSTHPSTNTTQPSPTSMTATAASATVQTTSSASTTPSATTPSASPTASQASAAAAASTSSASSGGNAGREVLRKVEDMGFSKDAIARAVRHFQQAGKTKISADALVEKIIELDSDNSGNTATGGNSTHHDGLQTDGPEGASNYGADADIQRAQRILSENERLKARQKCKLCKEAKVGMIFLPCGHIIACTQCGSKTKNCTHCGEFIRATANVFLS